MLEAVASACPVVGLEVTAFHAPEDRAERERMTALLSDAVQRLLPT